MGGGASGTRKRRVPALLVVLGVFAVFVVSVIWFSDPPDRVPGTIEYRSVEIAQGLARGDEQAVLRQVAGGEVGPDELQQLWQEAEATYGEHLRTGRPFVGSREDTTVWVIVPVEFANAGVGLQFAYQEGLRVEDRLVLTDVRLAEVTETGQRATQTAIVVALVVGTLVILALVWRWRSRS